MTDDLVARLRHTTERMGRECSVPNFDLWNDHSNACLEAADRLEAAEARVRELEVESAALNERAAQYERLYRDAKAETITWRWLITDAGRAALEDEK